MELQSEEDDDPRQDETVTVAGVQYPLGSKRKREAAWSDNTREIAMGEIVAVGEYSWERIEELTEDSREVLHFDTTFRTNLFHNEATEAEFLGHSCHCRERHY